MKPREKKQNDVFSIWKFVGIEIVINVFQTFLRAQCRMNLLNVNSHQNYSSQTEKYYHKIELDYELNEATSLFRSMFVCTALDLCA